MLAFMRFLDGGSSSSCFSRLRTSTRHFFDPTAHCLSRILSGDIAERAYPVANADELGTPWWEKIWLGKNEVSDEHFCGCRKVRRQPPSQRLRNDLLDEIRGTPWDSNSVGVGHLPFVFACTSVDELTPDWTKNTGSTGVSMSNSKI